MIKRVISMALALMLVVACFVGITVSADEVPTEFDLFIAYGGDKESEGDWGWQYYGADAEGITAVNSKIKVGETATVSLTFETANVNSWFFAPCLIADGVSEIGDIDFDITLKIDGQDVAIDMNADSDGRTWWTEDTGDYKGNCIRLAGGYNEWATKYIAEPAGFTTIEYTVTLNAVSGKSTGGDVAASVPEQFDVLIAYGGDKETEGDWGWGYTGGEVEGITAVNATIKAGETVTVSLTFATPTVNTWYMAPCFIAEGASAVTGLDFTVTCKIDGEEVAIDLAADSEGKVWWTEGTGDYSADTCIRLAGGYNEWAAKYIAEPASFTTVEYTITLNSISGETVTTEPTEPAEPPVVDFDTAGTYNAYLMLQTPAWTFRNAWDDEYYGINGSGWESIGNTWGQYLVHTDAAKAGMTWGTVTDTEIKGNGTYSVKITDFGTLFSDDFASAGQDYFNIIAVSTDIPFGAAVEITNVKLIIDGQSRHTQATAVINEESGDYIQIMIQNIWNDAVKEISYYPAPSTSLEIQFTISGFSYDNAEQSQTNEPTVTPTEPKADDTTEPSSPIVPIIIAVVAVAAIAVVVVVVLKKKKAN